MHCHRLACVQVMTTEKVRNKGFLLGGLIGAIGQKAASLTHAEAVVAVITPPAVRSARSFVCSGYIHGSLNPELAQMMIRAAAVLASC